MATTTRTVTYQEWLNMPVVDYAIEEVVNGEIRITSPNKWKHALIVENLARAWGRLVAMFVKKNIAQRDGYIHSAPELVVEVLSPAKRGEKRRDYESLRILEDWVLSPEARTIEGLQLRESKLETVRVVTEGHLPPKLFPAVAVDVSSIWPD